MQSPPPYFESAPRKSNVGLIIGIVVLVVCLCCILPLVGFGYFGYKFVNKAVGFVYCGMTMGQLRDGMLAYAKDHDGKLPAKDHWQDDIQKYVKPIPTKGQQPFKLPDPNGDVCDASATSAFTYNEDLAGKKVDDIKNQSKIIILWETPGLARNKSQKYVEPGKDSGPELIANQKRSWILQPLDGDAYYYNQGVRQSIPNVAEGGNVNVDVKTDGDGAKVKTRTTAPTSTGD